MNRFWVAAADLVLGADCPGCGMPAVTWCRACALQLRPIPRPMSGTGVPAMAAGLNEGVLRELLIAWKEGGRAAVGTPLGTLLASAVSALDPEPPLVLVPVPTDRRNVRRRGGDCLADLARVAAAMLRGAGLEAHVELLLHRTRRARDQVGLSAHERRANVRGVFALRRSGTGRVVVVDDILTTGASATEAVQTLRAGGWQVEGVATVAHTPIC